MPRSTTPDHAARDHATWSASASARRWGCPGSLVMEAGGPPDKESEAAAWGTACHEVAESCLRSGADAADHIGSTVKTRSHSFDFDDEMAETTQVYLDYVRERAEGRALLIEQKFSLGRLNPPFEAGGTGDAVILDYDTGLIEIVDLKGGRGVVVEAKGNAQLRTYGLGAVLANPGKWRTVRVTIVQPRAPHPDGRIRSEEFHLADLMDWTADLMDAMRAAKQANDEYREETPPAWALKYLAAGDHCRWCRRAATCPALKTKALAEAHVYFDDESAPAKTPPPPADLDTAQLVRVLDHADMIGEWLNAVRAEALRRAEAGMDVSADGSCYILVEKRARRKWKESDDLAAALATATGREAEEFFAEPKLMSPAQVDKLLGKKGAEKVKALWEQPSTGFNLVRDDKTTREAAPALVHRMFQEET